MNVLIGGEKLNNEQFAAQLRKPMGSDGIEVSLKMNESNGTITSATIAALNLDMKHAGSGSNHPYQDLLKECGKKSFLLRN